MALKIIIAGGGTGGHIFPALAIADELKSRDAENEVLFVGAKGGMEMDVVPRHGYEIKAVWISGIQRQLSLKNIWRNLLFPIKLFTSIVQSGRIFRSFRPDAVVGVGGYASGPMGRVGANNGVPLILCEQNAYPGLVNRWLAKKASRILLGNEAASRFFEASKVKVTGNPIRKFAAMPKAEAAAKFGLDPNKPIVLSVGGSLGAQKINEALQATHKQMLDAGVQLIWQTGKRYFGRLNAEVEAHPQLKVMAFIDDMNAAYGAADLVISRAGGSTISEMIALAKPSILIPSPNVSEDHQTKNARSLSDIGAAILIKDKDAKEQLVPKLLEILNNKEQLENIKNKIASIEKHQAAKEIVDEILLSMNNEQLTI